MGPKLDPNYCIGASPVLLCPNCNDGYLHHVRVEVFERSEDQETGLHVVVDGGEITVDKNLEGNPSSRRHGLSIFFECENCSAESVLTVAQHKGNTFVENKKTGKRRTRRYEREQAGNAQGGLPSI